MSKRGPIATIEELGNGEYPFLKSNSEQVVCFGYDAKGKNTWFRIVNLKLK